MLSLLLLSAAGWAKVGITWAYSIVIWLLADVAKTLSQKFFIKQERVKEDCKMHNRPVPAWARAIDWPSNLAESACEGFERATKVREMSFSFSLLCALTVLQSSARNAGRMQ